MTWLLTRGEYSDYRVIAVIPDDKVDQLRADLAAVGDDDFMLEERPTFTDCTVREVEHWSRWCAVGWDGSFDEQGEFAYDEIRVGPMRGEDWEDDLDDSGPCDVARWPWTLPPAYVLGVALKVAGTDVERCRKVYAEKRAELRADPDLWTVRVCVQQPHRIRKQWLDAPVNATIADALRHSAGAER